MPHELIFGQGCSAFLIRRRDQRRKHVRISSRRRRALAVDDVPHLAVPGRDKIDEPAVGQSRQVVRRQLERRGDQLPDSFGSLLQAFFDAVICSVRFEEDLGGDARGQAKELLM